MSLILATSAVLLLYQLSVIFGAIVRPIPLSGGSYVLLDPNQTRIRNVTDEERLNFRLFRGYDFNTGPVYNGTKRIEIKVGVTLAQLLEMDEVKQILCFVAWINVEWRDERLLWNPKQFNGMKRITVKSKRVWLPDLVVYNSAELMDTSFLHYVNAVVDYRGKVTLIPQIRLHTICVLDPSIFPFDDAVCRIKFGSWSYDTSRLVLKNQSAEADLSRFVDTKNWLVERTKLYQSSDRLRPVVRASSFFSKSRAVNMPFGDVELAIYLTRKYHVHYIFYIFVPCIFVELITLMCFWLDPRDGEKITLGSGLLLMYIVLVLVVSRSIPRSPIEVVPLINIYLALTLGLTGTVVAIQVGLLNLYVRPAAENVAAVPEWVRRFVLVWLARVIRRLGHEDVSPPLLPSSPEERSPSKQNLSCHSVSPSLSIDSLEASPAPTNESLLRGNRSKSMPVGLFKSCQQPVHESGKLEEPIGRIPTERIEAAMLFYSSEKAQNVEEKRRRDEWFAVAFVLDRCAFYLGVLVTLVANFILLFLIPYYHVVIKHNSHVDEDD